MDCHSEHPQKKPARPDYLLWGSLITVVALYLLDLFQVNTASDALNTASATSGEMLHAIWWGILLGVIFVGILGRIPREFVMAMLGSGGNLSGLIRAAGAGVLLDLCSHGILMVGMKLYERGASLGQTMAFLIASPWNSFSLTLILFGLIGVGWTLAFIALSLLIAIVTGAIFDALVKREKLPASPYSFDLPGEFQFWEEARLHWQKIQWSPSLIKDILWEGLLGSRMVLRWVLFGVCMVALLRATMPMDMFQSLFGPTLAGLGMTVIAATVIEVCSEGSTPIAADLMNRANAPGNSFAFLMVGVSTDYTEIMSIKDTMSSWKIALFLPLLTLPQVILISLILNSA